jgi:hypothetical protein
VEVQVQQQHQDRLENLLLAGDLDLMLSRPSQNKPVALTPEQPVGPQPHLPHFVEPELFHPPDIESQFAEGDADAPVSVRRFRWSGSSHSSTEWKMGLR